MSLPTWPDPSDIRPERFALPLDQGGNYGFRNLVCRCKSTYNSPTHVFSETVVRRQKRKKTMVFDDLFRQQLQELFRWRRDVRRFKRDPVNSEVLDDLLRIVTFAPSVGLSEPWRFVFVDAPDRRKVVQSNFIEANAEALAGYYGERAHLYASLKLEGLAQAPVHLAVFCDEQTDQGHGLGRQTMPEMLAYSVVAAIQLLWLFARAQGLGMGWISILNPLQVKKALEIGETWRLIAYLCLGYPEDEHTEPELAMAGWEKRKGVEHVVIRR